MKKAAKSLLKLSARASRKLAIKSCGATSYFDTYQPVRPESLTKLAFAKKNG